MRIRKYDFNFGRRHFMGQLGKGVLATGVLSPLWKAIADTGDIAGVYPDELMSIEGFTQGKVSTGDMITADNVELVKDLLDPIRYTQIAQMGRQMRMIDTTTDIMKLSAREYNEATLRNYGKAMFNADGNVVTKEGKPWIGGNPFPNPTTALEVFAGITLSWGRHDASFYAIKEQDVGPSGDVEYN